MNAKTFCLGVVRAVVLGVAAAFALPTFAGPTEVDFESFSDSTNLTTEIAGLTFTNATVLTAGISLNEFEFPPHSGDNVIFDDGGAIGIVFDALQANVGGYFTYGVPLTLTAFDVLNNPVASDSTDFLSNLALSGSPGSSPNEFLGVAFNGIKSVMIAGDPLGFSFALDDLTYQATVPEPPTAILLCTGLILAFRKYREKRRV